MCCLKTPFFYQKIFLLKLTAKEICNEYKKNRIEEENKLLVVVKNVEIFYDLYIKFVFYCLRFMCDFLLL